MPANRETLFDLITVINDRRRSLESAALHTSDPAQRAQLRQLSRTHATAVSRITRAIARHEPDHALPRARLEAYVDKLIEAYTDDDEAPDGAPAPAARQSH